MGRDLNGRELGKGITQRQDGKYHARVTDGNGKRISLYGWTLAEVQEKMDEKRIELKENDGHIVCTDKLDFYFEQWMKVYKIGIVRQNTIVYYTQVYKLHISPKLGRKRLCDITKFQIQALVNELREKGYSWESQNKVRLILRDMFERAVEDCLVTRNPAKGVRIFGAKKRERQILSIPEQDLFFERAAGTFYDNLFRVAVETGMRPGELFALTKDDLNFERREITVRRTLVYQKYPGDEKKKFHFEQPKTLQSVRTIPMTEKAKFYFERAILQKSILSGRFPNADFNFEQLIFVSAKNTPLNVELYNAAIRKIVHAVNELRDPLEQLPMISGHTFRHIFATRCLEAGIQPKTLQAYLGHATIQMTMDLYVHVTDEFKHEEIARLEEYAAHIGDTEKVFSEKIIRMG